MSTYPIEGKKLASVTTIISDCTDKSPALTQWAANMVVEWIRQHGGYASEKGVYNFLEKELDEARFHFREVSKEALDVGSKVHQAIEDYFNLGKEPINPPEQVLSAFVAFLEWVDVHKVKVIEAEMVVNDGQSAGTLDFIGYVDGDITVIDFKSSKAIYPEMRYQTAAYRHMYNWQHFDVTAVRNAVLRLDKETGFPEYKDFSKTYLKDLNVYMKMVDLYYARHPRLAKGALIDIKI